MRIAALAAALLLSAAAFAAEPVVLVPLEGPIGPAAASFVHHSIEQAAGQGARLVVLRIDTPGGLDASMREIVKAILASPVPVAAFVAPSGARAASAGTFIVYASHFAAMAPGTNVGAASPVALGGGGGGKEADKGESTEIRKATNDAVAYIRSLATLRGRNADWAERAVREGVSLPADEALKLKVVDAVVPDVAALTTAVQKKLGTPVAGAAVRTVEPDWRSHLLGVITNPSVAYLLLLAGAYALLFEFLSPGLILPGVVGAIALLLGLYALHLLPVNYAGLALLFLGIGLMVTEAFVPAFGSLGLGGLAAFVLGSLLLLEDTDLPAFEIPYALIGGVAVASGAILLFGVGLLVRVRGRRVVSGREGMIGARAEALEDFSGEGWARVHGERWKVNAPRPVRRGERLRVTGMRGLVLDVEPEGD